MPKYEGRLELTWTNKQLRLLAHEDGSYEWVSPADYRVAEVRLLHDAGSVGDVHDTSDRAKDNLLIRGDALNALTSLIELPEFACEYVGKVKLAYLDPPFNTQQSFLHYDDALEHSVWLTMMRDRLIQVKMLLAPDGSAWVHCDDSEQAYLKAMMDEVFGRECFVTAFIWQKVDSPNDNKVAITPDHEYVLCYEKASGDARFAQMPDPSVVHAYGQNDEEGRSYRDRLLKKNGKNSLREDRPSMYFDIPDPDGKPIWPLHDDGREACWALGKAAVIQLLDEGEIVWKRRPDPLKGGEKWVPYTREYAPSVPARPWPTIWTDVLTTRQAKQHLTRLFPGTTPFATPKPEQLIGRILTVGSQSGDIVLDCFVGSGTTAAVAHKMDRRWVVSDVDVETLNTFATPRLTRVVQGADEWGITEAAGWEGGGGFRILDVGPSMFDSLDGQVFLSEWATNGKLAEVTAAQLHYDYEYDPPFCGRLGRSRLAVVDGLVSEGVVRLLVSALTEEERLVICGVAIDPAAREVLRELRSGSSVRKIPQSILQEYRHAGTWSQPSLFDTSAGGAEATAPEAVKA